MCIVKTPKAAPNPVGTTTPVKPVYMQNEYLDGLGISAEANGRNSLRIDPAGGGDGAPAGGLGIGTGSGPRRPWLSMGPAAPNYTPGSGPPQPSGLAANSWGIAPPSSGGATRKPTPLIRK